MATDDEKRLTSLDERITSPENDIAKVGGDLAAEYPTRTNGDRLKSKETLRCPRLVKWGDLEPSAPVLPCKVKTALRVLTLLRRPEDVIIPP